MPTLYFAKDKETKNTIRFKETADSEGVHTCIEYIYIRKDSMIEHQLGDVLKLELTNKNE